jgi:hypothetical protein
MDVGRRIWAQLVPVDGAPGLIEFEQDIVSEEECCWVGSRIVPLERTRRAS